eukprot:356655-Hanusia_phi.AAC.2
MFSLRPGYLRGFANVAAEQLPEKSWNRRLAYSSVFHEGVLQFLWFLTERMASKETTEMDDISASQGVSGDSTFKRIRSCHFRRLKASIAYSAIIAGTVRHASHSRSKG